HGAVLYNRLRQLTESEFPARTTHPVGQEASMKQSYSSSKVTAWWIVFVLVSCGAAAAPAQETANAAKKTALPWPRGWQEDAPIASIHFTDRTNGWAVGGHGVAWRTRDGGVTWEHVSLPCD